MLVHHVDPFFRVTTCFCKHPGTVVSFYSQVCICKCSSAYWSVLVFCVTCSKGVVHSVGVRTGNGVGDGGGNEHHSYLFSALGEILKRHQRGPLS